MFFTYFVSIILTQFLSPYFADFSNDVALKEVLLRQPVVAEAPTRKNLENLGPVLTGRSAVAIDVNSRTVLWSENLHNRYPIASISKLMTVLVFFDSQPDFTKSYTLTSEDMTYGGRLYIDVGETVTYKDLLYSALIASDNNAAQALINASGLSREEFVARMNTKAQEIGMLNSNFVEPTGLEFANISSVQDVALLLEEAIKNPIIADALSREVYSFESEQGIEHHISNTNILLDSYLEVVGGKTGFNNEAQYNYVAMIKGDDHQVLLVGVLGSNSITSRFQDVKALADWSLTNYEWSTNLE